jgi:hypothetical protein
MTSLEHVCFEVVPKALTIVVTLQWATPICKKLCMFAHILVTFYEEQTHFGALFSFVSKQNLTRLATIYSLNINESSCQVGSHDDDDVR